MDAREFHMPDRDNGRDRRLGTIWEQNFCVMAARCGRSFTPHQWGRNQSAQWYCHWGMNGQIHPLLLPDVTIWSAPGEHHEVKHKNPADGDYGLEEYRLKGLLAFGEETRRPVMYTIHDWQRAGAKHSTDPMPNRLSDWLTVDVRDLEKYLETNPKSSVPFPTWVNGCKESRPGFFWPSRLWRPLAEWWKVTK